MSSLPTRNFHATLARSSTNARMFPRTNASKHWPARCAPAWWRSLPVSACIGELRDDPVFPPTKEPSFDSQNLAFWSESEHKYVAYYRTFKLFPGLGRVR